MTLVALSDATLLCAGRDWRGFGQFSPLICRILRHSSSRTGATDRRDWRISSIFASAGSALISASVTGRGSGRTGSTRTRTHSGALGSGSRRARHAHDPDHRLVRHAVVEEGLVAGLHRLEVQPRGVVADAVPFGAAVAHQIGPAVALGLGFHQPAAIANASFWDRFVTRPAERLKPAVNRAGNALESERKLNNLKGFRIPSRVTNGSPLGGLASVNASHIWVSAIESERAEGALRRRAPGQDGRTSRWVSSALRRPQRFRPPDRAKNIVIKLLGRPRRVRGDGDVHACAGLERSGRAGRERQLRRPEPRCSRASVDPTAQAARRRDAEFGRRDAVPGDRPHDDRGDARQRHDRSGARRRSR